MDEETAPQAETAVAVADPRAHVCAIATPLASEKLTKKCLKLVKKGVWRRVAACPRLSVGRLCACCCSRRVLSCLMFSAFIYRLSVLFLLFLSLSVFSPRALLCESRVYNACLHGRSVCGQGHPERREGSREGPPQGRERVSSRPV